MGKAGGGSSFQTKETDVLVIGGGLTGLWAAVRAKNYPVSVLVLDKGKVSKTGCSSFAAGDIACPFPEEDLSPWLKEVILINRGLGDRSWAQVCLEQIYHRLCEMESFGAKFEKRDGRFARLGGRGKAFQFVMVPGKEMMTAMRRQAEKLAVEIWDRFVVLKLLVEEGRCLGAVAMQVRTGEIYAIRAKAIILAAGGCGFRGTYYGHHFATGDSHALAFQAGVEQLGFEFVNHNTTHRDYDTCGMGRFVGSGGRFLNGLGQPFMKKYDPEFVDRAPLHSLVLSMAREVQAGRGPIYLDLGAMSPDVHDITRRFLPHMALLEERTGMTLTKEPMAWVPASGATYGMFAGCKVDIHCRTNMAGLFAAGAAGAMLRGIGGGLSGAPLMACCVSGYVAGENAARTALEKEDESIDFVSVENTREAVVRPIQIRKGLTHHELLARIQQVLFPYQVMLIKHRERLAPALKEIIEIKEKLLPRAGAADIHEAVKLWETGNILLVAELFLRASLERRESRGFHFREDFPGEDNEGWLKWLVVKKEDEKMVFRGEPVI